MAASLIETEGKPEPEIKDNIDAETKSWLIENKLEKLISKFAKDKITLQDLTQFRVKEIDEFAKELDCTMILKVRLRTAMTTLIESYNKQKQKDAWDLSSIANLKKDKVKLDDKTQTVTIRNESSGTHMASILGTIIVKTGEVREWKIKIIKIAKKHEYYEAYIGIKSIDEFKGYLSGATGCNGYGVLQSHFSDDRKHFGYGGLIFSRVEVYRQKNITKNIIEGDIIDLKLDLKKGELSMKINNGQEIIMWKWSEVADGLRYKLYFNCGNSKDDYAVQLL